MTKEQIDSLAKSLDELRLGMEDGEGAHALQAMQGDTLLTSVISIHSTGPHIQFSPVPWGEWKTNSGTWLTASRRWNPQDAATESSCPNSWMRFEPLSAFPE